MKKIILLLMLVSSILLCKDIEEYKSIKVLESTIENRIANELSLYTNRSFNINVKLFVVQVDVSKDQIQTKDKGMTLPGIYLYDESDDAKLLNKDINSQHIDHIEVLITLDSKVDSFIEKMAKKIAIDKADISQVRGDKVTIKKMNMVKENVVNELAEIVKTQLVDFEDHIKKLDSKKDQVLLETKENLESKIAIVSESSNKNIKVINDKVSEQLEKFSQNQAHTLKVVSDELKASNERLYYWVGFITLALLVAAYLGFLYASQRTKHIKEDIRFIEDDLQKELLLVENKLEKKFGEVKSDSSSHAIDQNMINDLSTLVIARKEGVKEFIIEALNNDLGREKVALLIQHIGVRSIESMFVNSKELLIDILKSAENIQFNKENISQKIDALYQELLQYTNSRYKDSQNFDALGFLYKLSIDQLLLLIEGEDMSIKAFIISQIDKEKSAELFERLPEETRLYLYMEISNIKPMTEKEYITLAKSLSQKIVNLPQVNHFVIDGKDEMVERIKMIEPLSQKRMLEILMTQNIELYRSIRENYTFFQDIPSLDESLLKTLLLSSDEETTALSLMQFSEEDKNKLLLLVNERKMVVIDDKIRSLKSVVPSKKMLHAAQYRFTQEAEKIVNMHTLG